MKAEALDFDGRPRRGFGRWPAMAVSLLLTGASLVGSCHAGQEGDGIAGAGWTAKVGFDPSPVGGDGLYGPPDGRRALDFEFCIPDAISYRDQVTSIDSGLRFSTSPGRVGCWGDELLVFGNSHRPEFHSVLAQLARLPYVKRIERAWFE